MSAAQHTATVPPSDSSTREVRCSAAFPLPDLRPVPDFVGLPSGRRYVTVHSKFVIAQAAALLWTAVAVAISLAFAGGLAAIVSWPGALLLLALVVYVPAYQAVFAAVALVLDDPPPLKTLRPTTPVTVIVPVLDERTAIVATLAYLAAQDHGGPLRVIVVDRGSHDDTVKDARRAGVQLGLDVDVVVEPNVDRAGARNAALTRVTTPLLVVVDPGAYLHPSAVRLLVARLASSPTDTAAVAGDAVIRNHREGDLAEVLASEYALCANAVQRVNALFQGALVAEAVCSVYRTDAVRAVNGWPSGGAQDVQLAWRFLERGWRVFHEPLGLAFVTRDIGVSEFSRRRARHAWGILAAVREHGRRPLRFPFSRFLTLLDASRPVFDLLFTIAWVQALVFCCFGEASLVGWYALFVVPVSLAIPALARRWRRDVLDESGLAVVTRSGWSWIAPLLWIGAIEVPIGMWAELSEIHRLRADGPEDVTRVLLRRPPASRRVTGGHG